MKYFIGILVAFLVIGGIFLSINIEKNKKDFTDTSITRSTSSGTTDLIPSNDSVKTLPSQMYNMKNVVIFKIDHNILNGNFISEIR